MPRGPVADLLALEGGVVARAITGQVQLVEVLRAQRLIVEWQLDGVMRVGRDG